MSKGELEQIAIVGPGAMGLLLAYFLEPVFAGLVLIDQFPERAKLLNEKGIRVRTRRGTKRRKVHAIVNPRKAGPVDLVILSVKAYDTCSAMKAAMPLVGKDTLVLTLQNGLGNIEAVREFVPAPQILAGTTSLGANVLKPGVIHFASKGETVIGQMSGGTGAAQKTAAKFAQAGLETRVTTDLAGALWSKVVVNAGINALTALLRVPNGRLLVLEDARRLMREAAREAAEVAVQKGVKLSFANPQARVEEVALKTADNLSSMLQDVRAGSRTEIDALNGAIVREAKSLKIEVPVNLLLTELVRALEKSYSDRVD